MMHSYHHTRGIPLDHYTLGQQILVILYLLVFSTTKI